MSKRDKGNPDARREVLLRSLALGAARAAFRGRRGHGGGPITRRTLTEAELATIVEAALRVYEQRRART